MANSSATYMFVMLDLDVPPEAGSTKRRVLLHAMNTGFKATKQKIGGSAMLLASSEKGPAAYIPPSIPAARRPEDPSLRLQRDFSSDKLRHQRLHGQEQGQCSDGGELLHGRW
jgi:hypothetical protein